MKPIFVLAGILAATITTPAMAEDVLVVTALQPTYSIAARLAEGTDITVANVPEVPVSMAGLARVFARPEARTEDLLARADAVIGIGAVWPEDPLYLEARERNIRVVEIDASSALSVHHASVSVVANPSGAGPWEAPEPASGISPYIWLSPANGIRMAEIVAEDLTRLSPEDADRIAANLGRFGTELREIKAEYEQKFLALEDDALFALTDRFAYLTNEFGLFVDGYFIEQDVHWTEADLAGLGSVLSEHGVSVVVHQWEPEAPIAEAVAGAGARLLVLGDGETAPAELAGPDGYIAMLRSSLAAIHEALSK